MMREFLITNNPMVYEKLGNNIETEYLENGSFMDVLFCVRDKIHKGHELLTHPLSGSVKPGETPYKSVIVSMASKENDMPDTDSLKIIENSIALAEEQIKGRKKVKISEKLSNDFQLVDLALISGK